MKFRECNFIYCNFDCNFSSRSAAVADELPRSVSEGGADGATLRQCAFYERAESTFLNGENNNRFAYKIAIKKITLMLGLSTKVKKKVYLFA